MDGWEFERHVAEHFRQYGYVTRITVGQWRSGNRRHRRATGRTTWDSSKAILWCGRERRSSGGRRRLTALPMLTGRRGHDELLYQVREGARAVERH